MRAARPCWPSRLAEGCGIRTWDAEIEKKLALAAILARRRSVALQKSS
jgi:hypothetical protein